MTLQKSNCPDDQTLQQFLLGQLSVAEIEGCQEHLSQCDPCVETVENLRIEDTFTEMACEVLRDDGTDLSVQDDQFISQMIAEAGAWTVGSKKAAEVKVSMDKAAEVQRLVREPERDEDLGAIGHFRLVRLIGTGSTGVVYLALDTRLDRNVVLKVLRPSLGEPAQQRFIAEAKATAAIDHPNVVTIYEVGNDGPLSYIAMQWIPGQTLEEKLSDEKSLSVNHTRKLTEQIAQGLSAAHSQGLIHRDIKPANIWIPDNDEPAKILDFGLVRVTDEDPQLTCTGMIAGTPCFMSPEQSRGDRLDERSDLFSLGCLMYQALTGQLPFRSDNALATLRSIQQDQPTNPSELDPAIDSETSDLIMCLLAKSPNRRPASADVLIEALGSRPEQWGFELVPAVNTSDLRTRSRISFWKLIAAALIGVALTAFGFAYGKQIVRIAMNEGEIKIETKVDDVKIEIVGDGNVVNVVDLATQQSIEIKAGKYEIRALGDGNSISIDKNKLTLSRGEIEIVQITRTRETAPDLGPKEIRVFPLSNADASVVFLTIKSVLGLDDSNPNTKITYNSGQNQIVATGNIEQLDVIARLIEDMDHDGRRKPVVQFDPTKPYKLAGGDVLGVFIDGVLGGVDEAPPVHVSDPITGLPPSLGFPILIEHDGFISLPFVESINADGKTLEELRQSINQAFKDGDQPLLKRQARIIVTLFKMRDQRSPLQPYSLDSGDVLGVFIDGVLGDFNSVPPIHTTESNTGATPSLGFPVWVEHDGCISLPHINRMNVRGKTISEIRKAISKAYKGNAGDADNAPLLNSSARILVNMIRPRTDSVNINRASEPRKSVNAAGGQPWSETPMDLSMNISELELKRSFMKQKFGPNHPSLRAVEKQLELWRQFEKNNAGSINSEAESGLPRIPTIVESSNKRIDDLKKQVEQMRKKADQGLVKFSEVYNAESNLHNAIINQPDAALEDKQEAATNLIRLTEEELELLSDQKNLKNTVVLKRWTELLLQRQNAIRIQTRLEREMGVPVAQPVFDGSTYHELLDIAKSERDLAKINKAIVGLVNLAGRYEREEVADAIMRIARRKTGIASAEDKQNFDQSMQQFFRSLDLESMTKIFVNEMEFGSSYSRRHLKGLRYNLRTKLPLFYQTLKSSVADDEQSRESAAAIAKVLAKTSTTKIDRDFAFEFLTKTFFDQWNALELDENESVKQIFESCVVEFKEDRSDNDWIPIMWKLAPRTKGFDRVIGWYLGQLNDRLLKSTGTNNRSQNRFANLRKEILFLENDPKLAETLDFEYQQYRFPELKISDFRVVVNQVFDVETLLLENNLLRSYKQEIAQGNKPARVRTYLDTELSRLYVAGPLVEIWGFQSELLKLNGGEGLSVLFPSTNQSRNKWYIEFSSNKIKEFKKQGQLVFENTDDRFVEEFTILPYTSQNNFESRPIIPDHEYENGTITFKITDENLRTLKRNALRHCLQERFRNQIKAVKLIYEKPAEADSDDT